MEFVWGYGYGYTVWVARYGVMRMDTSVQTPFHRIPSLVMLHDASETSVKSRVECENVCIEGMRPHSPAPQGLLPTDSLWCRTLVQGDELQSQGQPLPLVNCQATI